VGATLAEVFVYEGPEGSAPQTKEEFDVHDLWADRMDDFATGQILVGRNEYLKNWYNTMKQLPRWTELLKAQDERLLGKRVGSIGLQHTEMKVNVPRYAVKVYRLRNLTGRSNSFATHQEELRGRRVRTDLGRAEFVGK